MDSLKEKKHYESLLRVDLAGERGACYIYAGQKWAWAVLHRPPWPLLDTLYSHEVPHVYCFEKLASLHSIRKTRLDPLWRIGGWGLGAATGFGGQKWSMTCTAAIEEVIEEHYKKQKESLKKDDGLQNILDGFQKDESHHKEQAYAAGGSSHGPFFQAITRVTRLAIWLSQRV